MGNKDTLEAWQKDGNTFGILLLGISFFVTWDSGSKKIKVLLDYKPRIGYNNIMSKWSTFFLYGEVDSQNLLDILLEHCLLVVKEMRVEEGRNTELLLSEVLMVMLLHMIYNRAG